MNSASPRRRQRYLAPRLRSGNKTNLMSVKKRKQEALLSRISGAWQSRRWCNSTIYIVWEEPAIGTGTDAEIRPFTPRFV